MWWSICSSWLQISALIALSNSARGPIVLVAVVSSSIKASATLQAYKKSKEKPWSSYMERRKNQYWPPPSDLYFLLLQRKSISKHFLPINQPGEGRGNWRTLPLKDSLCCQMYPLKAEIFLWEQIIYGVLICLDKIYHKVTFKWAPPKN